VVAMTRLGCHRLWANQVRLWLSVIAYNLGKPWRRQVLPARVANWSLTSLQRRLAKPEAFDKACALLLVAAGGESFDFAAVWRHAAQARDTAGASGIPEGDSGFQIECEQTGRWKPDEPFPRYKENGR